METLTEFPPDARCIFCKENVADEVKFGKIYRYDDVITHYFCMLFSAEVEQNGKDDEGILGFLPSDIKKESDRANRISCGYCRTVGANINCCGKGCRKKFHYSCGVDNGSLHQFFDNFKSFCVGHRKFQVVPRVNTNEKHVCLVCYEVVTPKPTLNTIWAPCCKTAWFHRTCIQKMALNGGYFFRCPKCNNNDSFRREMKECGIYIPEQDASWELEPGAYEELGQRHNVCDANICRCPEGRSFQSIGTWEILLCIFCGSQGTHHQCSKSSINAIGKFTCSICSSVTNKTFAACHQPAEETPGPSDHISEERRHRRNRRPGRRKRIGSDNDETDASVSKRKSIDSFCSDDSDSGSTTSSMSSHVNSNVVVRFDPPIANIYEESDENESDVEYDARSYARLGNQLIHRPANVAQANSSIIDLDDSDDDVIPPAINCRNIISNENNEVTSTSVDDNIILEDDDDDDDNDVIFVKCDESKKTVDDDLPQPTALLRYVENNQVYIVSPADVKRRGGIEHLVSSLSHRSSTETCNPCTTNAEQMWEAIPLHKSVVHSFVASENFNPVISHCRPLDKFLEKTNSDKDPEKLGNEVICID